MLTTANRRCLSVSTCEVYPQYHQWEERGAEMPSKLSSTWIALASRSVLVPAKSSKAVPIGRGIMIWPRSLHRE